MLADEDNPMESGPETDAPAVPDPQVVVIYRSRGVPWLLIPPLLLVAAVSSIIAYRKSAQPEHPRMISPSPTVVSLAPDVPPSPDVAKVAASVPAVKPAIEPGPEPIRVASADVADRPGVRVEPAPPPPVEPSSPVPPKSESPAVTPPAATAPIVVPAPTPAATQPSPTIEPAPTPPVAPVEVARNEPVGFDPAAMKAAAGGVSDPKAEAPRVPEALARPDMPDSTPPMGREQGRPPSEEVQDELQREAEARIAERARIDAAGPDLLNPSPREVWNRRRKLIIASRQEAAQDRIPFHTEIRRIIAEEGNRAGPLIRQLTNQYGRDTVPEIHMAMDKDLKGPASRLSIPGRIQRMRRWGVPETIILDDLVLTEVEGLTGRDRSAMRGGPRSEGEAWLRAARILLSTPPAKPADTPAATPASAVATPGDR